MRIVLDTIGSNYEHVRDLRCLKIGYLNGPESAWAPEAIDEQRHRGELVGLVDVLGTSPRQASILDWEKLDVQDPARLRWWVGERNAFENDAVVYTNRDGIAGVINGLTGSGLYVRLIIADLTISGEPPLNVPDYGLPGWARLIGNQYVWPPKSGGPYDLSIIWDDTWHAGHAAPPAAVVLEQTAAAAVPVPSVPDLAAADAEASAAAGSGDARAVLLQDVREGATLPAFVSDDHPIPTSDAGSASGLVAVPKEMISDPGPTSSLSHWAAAQDPAAAPATTPSPANGADVTAASVTAGVSHETPGPAFLDTPSHVRPFVPAAVTGPGGVESVGAAAAAAPIDHGAVWRWIVDGRAIAAAFRGADVPGTAHQLELALDTLLEVGKLLSELGR